MTLKFIMKTLLPTTILLLTACGESSGDSVSTTTTTTTVSSDTAPITISSTNMATISTLALSSVFDNIGLAVAETFTGVIVEESTQQINISDTDWIFNQLNKALDSTDNFTGVITKETENCLISGSTEFTYDLNDINTISVNDSITLTSTNCDDGDGITNGSVIFSFTQLTNFIDLDDYSILGMNISFNDYSIELDKTTDVASVIGDYSIIINKDLFKQESNITSDKLTINIPAFQQIIQNLIIKKIYTENTDVETLTVSNLVINDVLGGSFTLTTSEELVFTSQFISSPSSGVLKVTGANDSSIVITVLNTSSVQLDADFNGDSIIDETRMTRWNDLTF